MTTLDTNMAPATSEREHEHIGQLVRNIQQLLDKQSALSQETAVAVETLRQFLVSHFALEENSPLFRDCTDKALWLRQPILELLQQHRDLRDRIGKLSQCANRQQPMPEGWAEFAIQFTQFGRDLDEHEHIEIDLLQRAYNEDIGTKD